MKELIVSKDDNCEFKTIESALVVACEDDIIIIKSGVYEEKVSILKNKITMIGEKDTIISFGDFALKEFENGEKYGTFRSYSFYVGAENFTAKNITFINSSGIGKNFGQALAIYVDADKTSFYDCKFLAFQDTVFLSPLPPKPIIPGSFTGPGKTDGKLVHRSYFKNCEIKGDIDFIFGGGTAFLEGCKIVSNDLGKEINGYISAASTPENQKWGLVFNKCKLVGELDADSVYLGRPWRKFAHTAFINCEMGTHIKKEGWDSWGKDCELQTVRYEEYGSYGAGGNMDGRVSWAKILTDEEAKLYTRKNVLGDWFRD